MESVRVVLSTPFEYASKGGMRRAGFVELRSPSSKAFRIALRMKQQLMRAVMQQQDRLRAVVASAPEPEPAPEVQPTVDEGPRGPAFLQMIAGSDADLGALAEDLRQLVILHGVALVDGEEPMTELLLDRLSMTDFEAVLGEYLATFPLA